MQVDWKFKTICFYYPVYPSVFVYVRLFMLMCVCVCWPVCVWVSFGADRYEWLFLFRILSRDDKRIRNTESNERKIDEMKSDYH